MTQFSVCLLCVCRVVVSYFVSSGSILPIKFELSSVLIVRLSLLRKTILIPEY